MDTRTRVIAPAGWEARFIEHFRETGNITASAAAAGIDRRTYYARLKANRTFAAAVEDAREEAIDRLEEAARLRAVDGVDEPVYQKGKLCGYVRRYSDALLSLLLRANRPDKYRERQQVDLSGNVGIVPITEIVIERPATATEEGNDQ